jgi:hypothetical protein
MAVNTLDWDAFMLAIYEGLDGISYQQAKKIHQVLYPEAKVTALRGGKVRVTWPEEKR